MKKIYYPNCSELIADFNTKDPKFFYAMMKHMGEKHEWEFNPPLTLDFLKEMKKKALVRKLGGDIKMPLILVLDKKGNYTHIEYGSNGYDSTLGFRFDSGCNHSDSSQYKFFATAVAERQAEMKAYDGGSTEDFERWHGE